SFTLRALFQLFINGAHSFGHKLSVLLSSSLPLLELPLSFEQRSLVYKRENLIERNLFDNARAVERRSRDFYILAHIRPNSVRSIARNFNDSPWPRRFANAQL